jgi:hypothetical protein
MNVQILQSAESEIADAMDYYNLQYPGLGYEFAFEVKESINRILSFPDAWPLFIDNVRKSHVNRFPYGILYEVREKSIIVFAVMHLMQDPAPWEKRLEK